MYKPTVIRLQRRGHKKYVVYNIIVISKDPTRRGGLFEHLGFINPQLTEGAICIDCRRVAEWLNKGAKLHPGVLRYLYYVYAPYLVKLF